MSPGLRRYAPRVGPNGPAPGVSLSPWHGSLCTSAIWMSLVQIRSAPLEPTHFVYLGLAIPAETWKEKDVQVSQVLAQYGLQGAEVHTGWIARRYPEQEKIVGFEFLDSAARRAAVVKNRNEWLIKTAALGSKEKRRALVL